MIPLTNGNVEDLLLNVIFYRACIGRRQTMEKVYRELGGVLTLKDLDAKRVHQILTRLKDDGETVFTASYVIPSFSWMKEGLKGEHLKIGRVSAALDTYKQLIPTLCANLTSSEQTYRKLRELPGIGPFFAYQIAVDLGYAHPDLYNESKHVVAGPGCLCGLELLLGEKPTTRTAPGYIKKLVKLTESEGLVPKNRTINLMCIENCLCEFKKYCRESSRVKFMVKL